MIECMKDCKYAQCSAGCKHWQAELDTANDALQDLYDEQNGPPLLRHEKSWQAAMDKAEEVLKGV